MKKSLFVLILFAAVFLFFVVASGEPVEDSESLTSESDPFEGGRISQKSRDAARKLIDTNHLSNRMTFFTSGKSLKTVPPVFCLPKQVLYENDPWKNLTGPEDIVDCVWDKYAESILLLPAITLIIAVLVWPLGQILTLCIRGCACGLLRPRKGCCCCGEKAADFDASKDGYSELARLVTFVVAIVAAVIVLVGMIVGMVGHVEVTDSLVDLRKFAKSRGDMFIDLLNSSVHVVKTAAVEFDEYVPADLVTAADKAVNWSDTVNDVVDTLNTYVSVADKPRQALMYVSLLVPVVSAILVILGCFVCSGFTCVMIVLGFFFMSVSLIIFAVNYPISYALSDACVYIDNVMNVSSHEYHDLADVVFECNRNSPLVKFTNKVKNTVDNVTSQLCTVVTKISSVETVPCDRDSNGEIDSSERCLMVNVPRGIGSCNVDNIHAYINYTFNTYSVGCYSYNSGTNIFTIREGSCGDLDIHDVFATESCNAKYPGENLVSMYCNGTVNGTYPIISREFVDSIQDPNVRGNATLLYKVANVSIELFDIYVEKIRPHLRCETFTTITQYAKDFVCVSLILGTTPIFAGEMLIAIGLLISIVVSLLGFKRFQKRYIKTFAETKKEEEMTSLVS